MKASLVFIITITTVAVGQATVCRKASDCNPTECCKEGSQRKRFLFDAPGTCQPLRKQQESCDPFNATSRSNPNLRSIECPCESGYVCHSTEAKVTAHNSFCVHGAAP